MIRSKLPVAAVLTVLALAALAVPAAAQPWKGVAALGIEVKAGRRDPLEGAQVLLRYAEIDPIDGPPPLTTDADGRVEVQGLASGRWRVDVSKEGYSSYLLVVALEPDGEARIVSGPVRDATGDRMRIELFEVTPTALPEPPSRPPARPAPPERAPEPVEPSPAPPARPEPAPPTPVRPEPAPPPAEPESAPAEPESAPAEPEPAPAEPEPAPPAPAVPPEPAPVPEPPAAAPEPEPEAPAAAPVAPAEEPGPEPEPEEVPPPPETAAAPEPEPPSEPAPPVEPQPAAPVAPAEEPGPEPEPEEVPPPAPPVEREPAPPVEETPPAPPAPPPAAEPRPPPPAEAAPSAPAPAPGAPTPSAPVPAPAPPPLPRISAAVRSSAEGTCPECEPGRSAVMVEQLVGAAGLAPAEGCAPDLAARLDRIAAMLGDAGVTEAGPLISGTGGALQLLRGTSAANEAAALVTPFLRRDSACQALVVVLPPGARYTAYAYEASDAFGSGPCAAGEECGIGSASWTGEPTVIHTSGPTVVYGVFRNASQGRQRRAVMTVYFEP